MIIQVQWTSAQCLTYYQVLLLYLWLVVHQEVTEAMMNLYHIMLVDVSLQ